MKSTIPKTIPVFCSVTHKIILVSFAFVLLITASKGSWVSNQVWVVGSRVLVPWEPGGGTEQGTCIDNVVYCL